MKLNLLPTKIATGEKSRSAVIQAIILGVIGIVVAVMLIVLSSQSLSKAKSDEADARTQAQAAVDKAAQADAIMGSDVVNSVARDVNLSKAMMTHNSVYPDLYDEVRRYIPPFFRVTSMSAAPVDDKTSTVTLTGVITSYQQYADLMLALLRIPGATGVSRSGFQDDDAYVPGLNATDQTGRIIKPGQSNLPDDPYARLQALEAQAQAPGYLGAGNFGSSPDLTRGAMPGESLITVQVTLPKDLQTPDPRATLTQPVGSGGATASAGAAGIPAGPGGPAGVPAGAPPEGGGSAAAGSQAAD